MPGSRLPRSSAVALTAVINYVVLLGGRATYIDVTGNRITHLLCDRAHPVSGAEDAMQAAAKTSKEMLLESSF